MHDTDQINSITCLVYIYTLLPHITICHLLCFLSIFHSPLFLSRSTTPQQPHTVETQAHKEQEEELLHLTTPPSHTMEAQVHNKEQEEAPLLLITPQPHTMEVKARKDDGEEHLQTS
jgi:hypothetical protein